MSYPLLAGLVVLAAGLAMAVLTGLGARPNWRALGLGSLGVLVLTAVFDSVIIAVGLVDYDPTTLLGPRIGWAPIEDFSYAIAAAIGAPVLFSWLHGRRDHQEPTR